MPPPTIAMLVHYPVKGLGGLKMVQATLTEGECMPSDRIYAIENGSCRFDAQNPKWFPKTHFLQLMRNERLASLALGFDDESHTLTLLRNGKQVAKGSLKTKLGRQMIEQFLSAYMKADLKGPPRIVLAEGHNFTDIAEKALHLVKSGDRSQREPRYGHRSRPPPLSRKRVFRGSAGVGGAKLARQNNGLWRRPAQGVQETGRCEATSVDPKTAQRGLSVPSALLRTWNHNNLGLYAKVIRGGVISTGDTAFVS